jgi:hypothetical protein
MIFTCDLCKRTKDFGSLLAAENFGYEVTGTCIVGNVQTAWGLCYTCGVRHDLYKKTQKIYILPKPKPPSKNSLMFEEFK